MNKQELEALKAKNDAIFKAQNEEWEKEKRKKGKEYSEDISEEKITSLDYEEFYKLPKWKRREIKEKEEVKLTILSFFIVIGLLFGYGALINILS